MISNELSNQLETTKFRTMLSSTDKDFVIQHETVSLICDV